MIVRIIEKDRKRLSQLFQKLFKNGIGFSLHFLFGERSKSYIESNSEGFKEILNDTLFKECFDILDNTFDNRSYKLYTCKKPHRIEGVISRIKSFIDKDALITIVEDTIKKINVSDSIEYIDSIKLADFDIEAIKKVAYKDSGRLKISVNILSFYDMPEKEEFDYTYKELERLRNGNVRYLFDNVKDEILNDIFISKDVSSPIYEQAFENFRSYYKELSKGQVCFINIWYASDSKKQSEIEIKNILDLLFDQDTQMQICNLNERAPSRKSFLYSPKEVIELFNRLISSINVDTPQKITPLAKLSAFSEDKSIYATSQSVAKTLMKASLDSNSICAFIDDSYIDNIKFDANYRPLYFTGDNEQKVNKLLENIVLRQIDTVLSQNMPVSAEIIDSDFINRFPKLTQLKDTGYVRRNDTNVVDRLDEFIQEVSFRAKELLNDVTPDITAFNKKSLKPKKIYFLLINAQDFYEANISEKTIFNFFENAAKCGIYILLFNFNEDIPADFGRYSFIFKFQKDELLIYSNKNFNILSKIEGVRLNTLKDSSNIIQSILDKSVKIKPKQFLSIKVGQSATTSRPVNFEMGEGNEAYHAIIVGATGTGKTVFINRIITDIAKKYDANQIRLILMDMKPQGVEFGDFKNHPNVEKIYLEPNRLEVAIDVLNELQEEIQARGALFRELSEKYNKRIVNIDQYNQLSEEPMPRKILIIDEVQRLFKDDFSLNMEFNDRLEDIARVGRAFGIHFILITQTLNGVRIRDSLKSQVKLRVSFRVASFADVMEIFDISNKLPVKLEKYQCVINDGFGQIDNNVIVNTYPPYKDEEREQIFLEQWKIRPDRSIKAKIFENSSGNEKENEIDEKLIKEYNLGIDKIKQRIKELEDSIDFED